MNKQKQIEEIAKDLKQIKFNMQGYFILQYVGVHEDITARELYDLGYRKIPENAMVLTNEEYNAHKKLAEAVYEGGAFDHYDNVINSANILFKERKNLIEDTRMEIAKEILTAIGNITVGGLMTKLKYDTDFRDICSKYGVEV